jgi:hypothetical protein
MLPWRSWAFEREENLCEIEIERELMVQDNESHAEGREAGWRTACGSLDVEAGKQHQGQPTFLP